MWPVLFTWHGIALRSYPVMIYVALLVTALLTVMLAQDTGLGAGLDPERTALALILSYIPGFIVARLLYVSRHWDRFGRDPWRILRRADGGLSMSGGMIGMVAGLIPLLWLFGLPPARFFDALALAMVAGVAIAKSACLLNGCCHGRPTRHWIGVSMPDPSGHWLRRYPSPLIEMVWALAVLLILLAWRSFSPAPGLMACSAFVLLPAGRLLMQKLRDEGAVEDAAVRKTACLFMAMAGAAGLFIIWL